MTSPSYTLSPSPSPAASWMEALERGLAGVEAHAPSPAESLSTIRKMCANVANHPAEPRYR
jgi:hypothetical protein